VRGVGWNSLSPGRREGFPERIYLVWKDHQTSQSLAMAEFLTGMGRERINERNVRRFIGLLLSEFGWRIWARHPSESDTLRALEVGRHDARAEYVCASFG
jgi:hypothetical protein